MLDPNTLRFCTFQVTMTTLPSDLLTQVALHYGHFNPKIDFYNDVPIWFNATQIAYNLRYKVNQYPKFTLIASILSEVNRVAIEVYVFPLIWHSAILMIIMYSIGRQPQLSNCFLDPNTDGFPKFIGEKCAKVSPASGQ